MAADFGKWWNDTRKHRKRLMCWLPHARDIASHVAGSRGMRYFTLCARSMIDVFMLVREGLLPYEPESHSIGSMRFCEWNPEHYAEMTELVGREDAGFLGRLEDVVLFVDDDFTAQFPTLDSISTRLEDEALHADFEKVDRLQLKRSHFHVRASFPYDYLNLDFCDYYYPRPPGVVRINDTVGRILDWQREPSMDEPAVQVDEFVLAVTCRHDASFPREAEARLAQLVRENCSGSRAYREELSLTRGIHQIEDWANSNQEDFFFAGWPKDIAHTAARLGWEMEILNYVFYRRVGDRANPYLIACLVGRFRRSKPRTDNIGAALYALRAENRIEIPEIARDSVEGRELLRDLREIVEVRNQQAARRQRPLLDDP